MGVAREELAHEQQLFDGKEEGPWAPLKARTNERLHRPELDCIMLRTDHFSHKVCAQTSSESLQCIR
jgi:hypothetical protein